MNLILKDCKCNDTIDNVKAHKNRADDKYKTKTTQLFTNLCLLYAMHMHYKIRYFNGFIVLFYHFIFSLTGFHQTENELNKSERCTLHIDDSVYIWKRYINPARGFPLNIICIFQLQLQYGFTVGNPFKFFLHIDAYFASVINLSCQNMSSSSVLLSLLVLRIKLWTNDGGIYK